MKYGTTIHTIDQGSEGEECDYVVHTMIDADRKVQVLAFVKIDEVNRFPRDFIVKVLNRCGRDATLESSLAREKK